MNGKSREQALCSRTKDVAYINIVTHFVGGCERWKNGQGQLRRARDDEEAVTQKSSREPS